MCDPGASGGPGRPTDVYNTPIVITDNSNSTYHTALWNERNVLSPGSNQGYFFAYFEPTSTPGTPGPCTIYTEEDFTIGSGILPSPTDPTPPKKDGSSASPIVLSAAGDRSIFFPTLQGFVNRFYIGSDALPDESDTGHYSIQLTEKDGGTDSSGYLDPNWGVMLWGNRCNPGPPSADCDYVSGTRDWGKLYLADLTDADSTSVLATLELEAWAFGAPIGLSTSSGSGGDELLIALGTLASTNSSGSGYEFNGDYDCSLLLIAVDNPSTGSFTLTVADSFDDTTTPGSFACTEPAGGYVAAVDGFGGEPVPYASTRFISQRFFGRLYSVSWNSASQSLSKDWSLQLTNPSGHEFRHPNEMSPVFATYPDDSTEKVALWGANQYELSDTDEDEVYDTDTFKQSVLMAVDLGGATASCSNECDVDITSPPSYAEVIDTFPKVATGDHPAVWGPGAAGIYLDKDDSSDQSLVFVIATGAITGVTQHTNSTLAESCDSGDTPPQLHFYYKKSTGTTWNHDYIDLTDSNDCYELVDAVSGKYEPIRTPAGVAIHGSSAYVATNNGLFWRYNTVNAAQAQGANNTHVLAGPASGWPRFRKNNFGGAREY